MRRREEERQQTKQGSAEEIGTLTDRELFLVGVGLYWAEGAKRKPHAPQERVAFINSDPHMIEVYLAWLRLLGVSADRLRFHVHIHETGNAEEAERYRGELVGADASAFGKTTLKKHNPKTNRRNTGEDYRGCLLAPRIAGCGVVPPHRRLMVRDGGSSKTAKPVGLPRRSRVALSVGATGL